MGRVGRLVVGYGLLIGGILIGAYGAFFILLGGESGQNDHPYAGFGIAVAAIGVAAMTGGFFVLHGLRRRGSR